MFCRSLNNEQLATISRKLLNIDEELFLRWNVELSCEGKGKMYCSHCCSIIAGWSLGPDGGGDYWSCQPCGESNRMGKVGLSRTDKALIASEGIYLFLSCCMGGIYGC